MAANHDPPLSLRPFPVADRQPKNLADFIARVNSQPGGFRGLTEQALRQQVRLDDVSRAAHGAQADDVPMSDVADDDDGANDNDNDAPATDPAVARIEVLRGIE